jgi:ankyrin repeat protein
MKILIALFLFFAGLLWLGSNELLSWGADQKLPVLVRLALFLGADSNANQYGHTPFHAAIRSRNTEIVTLCLERGAEVNALKPGLNAAFPLDVALRYHNSDMALFLLGKGADPFLPECQAFHLAAQGGMPDVVKKLIELYKGRFPGGLQYALDSALFSAIEFAAFDQERQKAMVAFLLAQGANPSAERVGKTPLTLAIEHRVEDIGLLLLGAGAAFEHVAGEQEGYKSSPLQHYVPLIEAIYGKMGKLAMALLDKGARPDVMNKYGETPLHKASYIGNLAMINRLLDAGVNVNAPDRIGRTPLDEPCEDDVKKLLESRGGKRGEVALAARSSSGKHTFVQRTCTRCDGNGRCKNCQGKGVFANAQFSLSGVSATSTKCSGCGGSGKCSNCQGKGKL